MRTDFDNILQLNAEKKVAAAQYNIESFLCMSYWYGGLYVVIEGWKELKLKDNIIDSLLDSPNVDLLRRYRNGTFHFQRNYFDERLLRFMRDGIDCVPWIRNLNQEFGRYFLSWYEQRNIAKIFDNTAQTNND